MAGLPGSIPSLMPAGEDELVRRLADLERTVKELGPSVARSFAPVISDLSAQVAFLAGQSSGYSSAKMWQIITGTSGTGDWELLAYDATYDDQYTFQASSSGVLEITISSMVMVNNGGSTWAGSSRGYSLTWPDGSLNWESQRAARISGLTSGAVVISASNVSIVSVAPNAMVTLQTRRARQSPIAPATAWHGAWDTTVVVTRVGM